MSYFLHAGVSLGWLGEVRILDENSYLSWSCGVLFTFFEGEKIQLITYISHPVIDMNIKFYIYIFNYGNLMPTTIRNYTSLYSNLRHLEKFLYFSFLRYVLRCERIEQPRIGCCMRTTHRKVH